MSSTRRTQRRWPRLLRLPDLKPIAKRAPGTNVDEVWISGDGRTVYTIDKGRSLFPIYENGTQQRTGLTDVGSFFASEHG